MEETEQDYDVRTMSDARVSELIMIKWLENMFYL